MRLSLHRFPRESKVAAAVLGAALLQVGVFAALGLKITSERREAFAKELAERAHPVVRKVVEEAVARVAESERNLARALRNSETVSPWVRVTDAVERRVAPLFEYAYLVGTDGRLTDHRRAPYDAPPSAPPDEAARARLAEIAALEKTEPARALAAARALAESLGERSPHDAVAAALALQSCWRAALAMKDRDAARVAATALLARYRTVRDDRGPLAESEPLGPAASAVLARVTYDSIVAAPSQARTFVDVVADRRIQAQRLRPLLTDAAYEVEVAACEDLRAGATLLVESLQLDLRRRLEQCDALDQALARAASPGRRALREAASGAEPVRFTIESNWLMTVVPLPGGGPGDPIAAAFVAPPSALKAEALDPAARAPALPEGLAFVVRDAGERDVLGRSEGPTLLEKSESFGTAVPGLHANVVLVDPDILERETTSARRLWLAILGGAGLAVVAASLLAVRAVMREVRIARMKSDFVSNLSHELRTPLTSLRMFVETLREGRVRDKAEAKECLDIVAQETDRLQTLVERMLQFGSFTRGRAPIELKSADAGEVARRAVAVFAKRAEAARASIELAVEGAIPETILDRDAVLQVLINLLDNAVKYAGHDGAKIRVGVRAAAASGPASQRVVIEVEDDGPGVPEKERQLVFEEFYRGDDTLSRRVEGTGIGLAVARRIVLAHGGTIEVTKSERLGGASFRVTLPEAEVGRRLAIEASRGGGR